jgi:hypothetical protein
MRLLNSQPPHRASAYVETDNGQIERGFKGTYKRHGALNLFAALQEAAGEIKIRFRGNELKHCKLGPHPDQTFAATRANSESRI